MSKKRATTFGQRLAAVREKAGLTREELADKAGITRQAIWRIESDLREPNWDTLCKIADALKVKIDELRP